MPALDSPLAFLVSARTSEPGSPPASGVATPECALDSLLSALDIRGIEPPEHVERVVACASEIAAALGLGSEECAAVERGALLHDVGLVAVPDRLLRKAGPLTGDEWAELRRHTVAGHRLCVRVASLADVAEIVLSHHERWDGSGYPRGLAGEAIPLGARIVAVADALDAMASGRPHRAAVPFAEAAAEIARHAGTQFDPHVVTSVMSLSDERLARIAHLFG